MKKRFIRNENEKVTITLKKYPKNSKFAMEYEVLLDKKSILEDAKKFLLAQGYIIKAYQETLREKWSIR